MNLPVCAIHQRHTQGAFHYLDRWHRFSGDMPFMPSLVYRKYKNENVMQKANEANAFSLLYFYQRYT